MVKFAELDKVRSSILDSIQSLLVLRQEAEAYATTPNDETGERLVSAFNKFSSYHDGLNLHLMSIIKNANAPLNNEDEGIEIIATETKNGLLLK